MDEATLCYPIVDEKLLLIRKQRGLGRGKIVGPGGKIERGETPKEAVQREVNEELKVDPIGLNQCGEFEFHFRDESADDDSMYVYVFTADEIDGEPQSTDEAVPVWYPTSDPPYDEMWVDDRVWMPHMLNGESFTGIFVLSDDAESLLHYEMECANDSTS